MARATLNDRLCHMLDEIALVRSFVAGRSRGEGDRDPMLRRAVERSLEIISEASRHVPEHLRASHPEIPWRAVADIGNILRHGYDQIVAARIWDVVELHLDPLEQAVRKMLAQA